MYYSDDFNYVIRSNTIKNNMGFYPSFSVSNPYVITVHSREWMIANLFDFIDDAEVIVISLTLRPVFKSKFPN